MEVLAVVMARGGSKGIPRKNVADLGGQPLINWTLSAAQNATSLGRTVVSTNDPEIAAVAKAFGAEVPFTRPDELALDNTPGIAPSTHAVSWLFEHERYLPDAVMCLQPTSPFRTAADIDKAIDILIRAKADAVVGVRDASPHPGKTMCIADGWLRPFLESGVADRRQELAPAYWPNGAIYLLTYDQLMKRQSFYPERTAPYLMPADRSLDIDTDWDLHLARLIVADRASGSGKQG